jgi:hypothetical protein
LHDLGLGLGNVGLRHGLWHGVVLHAQGVGVHLAGQGQRAGGDDFGVGRHIGRMADAAAMHQLRENFSALGMHGVHDGLPGLHLRVTPQAGDAGIALAVGRGRDAFCHDQARRRTLAVVLRHRVLWRAGGVCAAACHGVHDQAVAQSDVAHAVGFEEVAANGHAMLQVMG